jgi:hypothetical protein
MANPIFVAAGRILRATASRNRWASFGIVRMNLLRPPAAGLRNFLPLATPKTPAMPADRRVMSAGTFNLKSPLIGLVASRKRSSLSQFCLHSPQSRQALDLGQQLCGFNWLSQTRLRLLRRRQPVPRSWRIPGISEEQPRLL